MTDLQRQEEYFELIDRLLQCPNGKEPEVLEGSLHLIDQAFIKTLIQVATAMAHDDNQQAAEFLMFIARELAKQLGFYPDVNQSSSNQEVNPSLAQKSYTISKKSSYSRSPQPPLLKGGEGGGDRYVAPVDQNGLTNIMR